jgi:hypothetical protein
MLCGRSSAIRYRSAGLFLAATLWCLCAAAQENTPSEFSPQINGYFHLNERTRLRLLASFDGDPNTKSPEVDFGSQLEFALKPVFRRKLRQDQDVFNKRFLSFRAGYRCITTLPGGAAPSLEHRWTAAVTLRSPLPGSLVVVERNSIDFRFVNNNPFSIRYRNKLQIERDFRIRRIVLTPYISGELDYDTRYSAWYRNRYSIGAQVPLGRRIVCETYFMRQNQSHSSPPHLNKLGLTFNLYF